MLFHIQSIYQDNESAIIRQFFNNAASASKHHYTTFSKQISKIGSHGKKSVISFNHGGQ